jgi:hypothetical protein
MSFDPILLGSRTITTALSDVPITAGTSADGTAQLYWDGLESMDVVTILCEFTYGGSGGTTAVVTVDTSLGSGGTWYPIARFDFTTTTLAKALTPSGLTPRTDAALTLSAPGADTAIGGFLGNRLRARLTTTGTYASGTQVNVVAQPR